MSLILEALRKSEAERRRGQTPDLLSDATPAAPTTRAATRNAGSMVAVAVAALVTLVLVAWWLRSAAEPDPAIATTGAADSVAATVPAAPPATAPMQARAAQPRPAAALTTAPAATAPPSPPSPPTTTPPEPPPPVPGATTAAAANTAPSAAVRTAPLPAPLPPPEPEPVATIEPLPAPPAFASQTVPLRLADLTSDERQQLPTLKVSMHMWASEAANRFAIIDGTRVNEGDRVGQATVEAIEQDGVLLAWQGRRIRLPIR
jgi:general secretion pathway protein B